MKLHVALCTFLVGCVADPPSLSETVAAVRIAPGNGDGCQSWECGSNSPVVEVAVNLWDLSEQLEVLNSGGYKVTFYGTRKQNYGAPPTFVSYRPDVKGGRLFAYASDGKEHSGAAVIGMMWRVVEEANPDHVYELIVKGIDTTPFWASSLVPSATVVPAATYGLMIRDYVLDWSTLPTAELRKYGPEPSPICGENPDADGSTNFEAVLFENDHLDAEQIRVIGKKANWFNIGCMGHALAKLHLTGGTEASAKILGRPESTVAQKTAFLKMITGDYCGGGHAFTFAGQPLRWKTDRYTSITTTIPLGRVQQLEARWNQHGAMCLNTPRVDFRDYTNDPGSTYFPDGVEPLLVTHTAAELAADSELVNWCTAENPRPPPCEGTHNTSQLGTLVTSVNYGTYQGPILTFP